MSQDFTQIVLPRIVPTPGGASSIEMLNAPIAATETVLRELAQQIAGMTNKSAILRKGAPLSSECFLGCLVFYNTDTQRFEPALAQLSGEPGFNETWACRLYWLYEIWRL